jgi:hypothetical protein
MIWEAGPTGKRGRQPDYHDAAIQTCLTMKVLFGMALRQTTGFVESLLHLIDLDCAELQHPQPPSEGPEGQHPLPRVAGPFAPLDRQHRDQGPLSAASCGCACRAMEGEGEWSEEDQKTVRGTVFPTNAQAWRHEAARLAQDPHPLPGRRMAHSPRGGIDEQTLEIRAAEFTTSDVGDAPMLPELLDQIPPEQQIASVTADGAFDTRKCHEAIAARGAAAIIPPRKNAKPWKPDTAGAIA